MRRSIWLFVALLCGIIICAEPTSSRAYFKYVPPQPQAKRYRVVATLRAHISRYIKPRREYYSSYREFQEALRMNGEGNFGYFGDEAEDGMIAADTNRFKRGTILYIVEMNRIAVVKDKCVKAIEESKRGIILFDVFSKKMTHAEAMRWGRRQMTVKILKPV